MRPDVAELARKTDYADYVKTPEDEALDTSAIQDVFASALIAGWEGVTDETGAPLPFSVAAAVKVLSAFPELWFNVRRFSQDASHYAPVTVPNAKVQLGN